MAGGLSPPPRLVAPCVDLQASFLAALREYQAEGRHRELSVARLADPGEFARYVGALLTSVHQPREAAHMEAAAGGAPRPGMPAGGYVPQTVLWWVAGGAYLGRLTIRHRLTPELMRRGGNIGYEVRPGERRRGHATAMLAAALPLAAALGVDPARIDCDADNVASRRVIEKNGGRLSEAADGSLFFWVPTSAGRASARPAAGSGP